MQDGMQCILLPTLLVWFFWMEKKEENDNEALNYNNHVVQLQQGLFHFWNHWLEEAGMH